MITEYEHEAVPGLPGRLPPGERIVWQGAPDWRALARTAFHTRGVAIYFAVLTAIALGFAVTGGGLSGVAMTAGLGVVGVALLHLLAWGTARTTIYTLTDRRIVLRIGMALPKCINLPLVGVGAVELKLNADGTGDVPLAITQRQRLGYAVLWPHARPWHLAKPQPMLRAVPDAASVGALIARHCLALQPDGVFSAAAAPATGPAAPAMTGALAA
jgi:hypothetical protein